VLPTLAAGRGDPPRFVFDHVFAPHSPQVFGPNGEPRPAITTVEWQDTGDADRPPGDYERAYVGELEYLNGLVLDAVDRLRAAIVRPSVVVLFGDHGSRTTDPSKGSRPDRPLEHFENLFAASTPDGSDDFGPDITLVNLLPTIANRYLGEHLPLSPNLAFVPEADGSVSVVDLDAVPR
jgi:hypothetical protein